MSADTKYQRWAFTAYEEQYDMLEDSSSLFKEIAWQDEICPSTAKKHRQGYLVTQTPMRFSAVRKLIPGIHLEPAKNFTALKKYCAKEETRDPSGSHVQLTHPPTHVTVDRFLDMLADLSPPEYPECRTKHYWQLVNVLLPSRPELASLAMQPGPRLLWEKTFWVWMDRARDRRERAKAESISITDEAPETLGDGLEFISLLPV